MRRFIVAAIACLVVAAFAAGPASATPTGTRGQPSQDCEALAASGGTAPPGFGTGGFTNAKNHYADSQNGNLHAVSQYDVACFQLSTP